MSTGLGIKHRILLAEDVNVIALTLARALERSGYDVLVARDGEECLQKALSQRPDLVVLDIMMPKMTGIEVLRKLRGNRDTCKLPVIICSAKDFKTERDEAMALGVSGYYTKSADPLALITSIQEVLSGRQGESPLPSTASAEPYLPVLDVNRAHFCLYGTRGSTPTLGGRFQRHGGNTSCMALFMGEDLLIFDAGSGIRDLGLEIMRSNTRKLHLFITHTHWDHIQGFPFFTPAYVPGFDLTIYGSKGFGKNLEALFRGQLDRDYFPVQLEDMQSTLRFCELGVTPIQVGGCCVTWEFSHHPLPTVGYKIAVKDCTLVWMPDNEFLQAHTGIPHTLSRRDALCLPYAKIIDFLTDADVVIHEAQYTADEYPKKIGWGHSSVPNACALMKMANVKRWIVTHHDPMHDDAFLESKLNLTRQVLEEIGHACVVTHGYDGMTEFLTGVI